jgi:eukaryotic-like serine/threonine-protein kinase
MSTLVGMQLSGRYRLDAQIGAGGMSTVYLAFDQTLERRVAIKLMHREIASDSDQLERFRREARAVAQLSHPHIVGVIDAGEDEGRPYIVFEYVEGETLKERIRRMGRLPMDEAIAYAIEIARALGCAHLHHIVHRDVKPQNVLIDAEGSAKVTDFGIARTLDQDGLTADGRVLGTTDYVSPEQALGHDVNGQSDIYSLGIVLFEMLTGDVPFHGENQVSVAMKHVREDVPDLQSRRPEASATLASVLDRMTDKDLRRRYPDIPALVADLEEALAIEAARSGRSTGEATAVLRTLPESTRRRLPFRMRHPLPVLATVLLLAVGVVALVLLAKEGVDRTQRGTGAGDIEAPAGEEIVSVASASASDYDPAGDDEEHPERANLVVDRDPDTTWVTESYSSGIEGAGKPGVGIYVDAKPGVEAVRMEIQTPRPGWQADIFGASGNRVPESIDQGWTRLGGGTVRTDHQRFRLAASGERHRFYLVWITALPEGEQRVEIGEIALFKRKQTAR